MVLTDTSVKACDPEVDRDGKFVCQLRDAPAEVIEEFVQYLRARCPWKIDWQYVNKMPTIFSLINVEIVMQIILDNIVDSEGIALYRATDKN